jgi:hypothetical protein
LRGLYAILLIALLVAASGCIHTISQKYMQTSPPTESPVTTAPTTLVFTTERTILPTTAVKSLISPYVSINDVRTHYVGYSFYINGWSDLQNGSRLHVDIMQQLGRYPQHGDVIVGFSGDTILNVRDSRRKSWDLLVDSSDFIPAMYDVSITSIDNPDIWELAYFNIPARPSANLTNSTNG